MGMGATSKVYAIVRPVAGALRWFNLSRALKRTAASSHCA